MKMVVILTILVLGLTPVASGSQYLTVNGEELDSVTLGAGQSCTFEVTSDNYDIYINHIGFDDCNKPGIFTYIGATPEAGACPDVNEYESLGFCGYYVRADCSPSSGEHFIFEYVAQEVGETDLKLYDISLTYLLDSIHITVVPAELRTSFTYQGRLIDDNRTAYGEYDFRFELYNAPIDSNRQGDTVYIDEKEVEDGIFTAELDFGTDVFTGEACWLEIGVRPGELEAPNEYTILQPRQKITPTPYAVYAKTAESVVEDTIPQGVIVMWSGSIGSIPSGWVLCDGSNGTPDLKDRFIVGAGSNYNVNDTGGEAFHTLTIAEMPSHSHTEKYRVWGDGERGDTEDTAYWGLKNAATTSVGGDQPHENRPPYYSLAYIMKL